MKKCFGYVRVSSHKQGEGVSLEAQKDAILRFASSNGVSIVRWFEEQQTAAKSGRPVFNSMLKGLKAGSAAGVVMHKIDRSARNFFDWAKIGELADSGIDVHFATESLDFRSRGGRLTANIQMAVAEDYVRNLRAEVLKGQLGQLERGFYPFGAPVGYQNNGKHQLKTIDPVKGPLVKQAFELYASGQYSLHSLRKEMAKRGLSKSNGESLSKGCFEKFLANPFYTGIIRIKRSGEVYQGAHEPLISTNLFEQVKRVRSGKSGKKITRHNHLFRGLFQCGNCGRSMIPERQKGYIYYRCQYQDCPRNCVREENLVRTIRQALGRIKLTDQAIDMIDKRMIEWSNTYAKPNQSHTQAMRLAKLDEQMEKLEDAAIAGVIDTGNFNRRKEKLLLKRNQLIETAQKTDDFHQNQTIVREFLERLKNLAAHYEIAKPASKREIIEIALSNRTVKNKAVSAEPSKWLQETQDALGFFSCAQARTTSRTSHLSDVEEGNLEQLAEIARSPEVARLYKAFMNGYQNAAFSKTNYQSNADRL